MSDDCIINVLTEGGETLINLRNITTLSINKDTKIVTIDGRNILPITSSSPHVILLIINIEIIYKKIHLIS